MENGTTQQPAAPAAPPLAPAAPVTPPAAAGGLAIAALVVGIVAAVSGWAPFWGVLVGAAAIVLSVLALKKKQHKGFAITGLVTGIVGAVWSFIITAFFILALAVAGTTAGVAGTAIKQADKELTAQDKVATSLVNAKKDFAAGSTATFGNSDGTFTVKVNSVNNNWTASDGYSKPDTGNKFVVANITVTNTGDSQQQLSQYDFKLNADGVAADTTFVSDDPSFDGGELNKGASASGNLVFEVKQDASSLKLQYDTEVYTVSDSKTHDLVYTLAL